VYSCRLEKFSRFFFLFFNFSRFSDYCGQQIGEPKIRFPLFTFGVVIYRS
jgi:hypothetical protein